MKVRNDCSDFRDDRDRDGVRDEVDNCVTTYNPQQSDRDADQIGDVCDDDIDNDGDMDILGLLEDSDEMLYFLNDGQAEFSEQSISYPALSGSSSLHVADMDVDGFDDIVFKSDSSIYLATNNQGGAFNAPQQVLTGLSGLTFGQLVDVVDFDSNGTVDLVVYDNHMLQYASGNNDLTFNTVQNVDDEAILDYDSWGLTSEIDLVDFDGDTDFDYFQHSYNVNAGWNSGGGSVLRESLFQETVVGPDKTIAADLNNDGIMDLVCGLITNVNDPLAVELVMYPGIGDGQYGEVIYLLDEVAFGELLMYDHFEVADMNGDGWADILFFYQQATQDGNTGIHLMVNAGDGSFNFPQSITTEVASNIVPIDIDNDGDLDLLKDSPLAIIENMGSGNFASPVNLNLGLEMHSDIATGDIDGDGDIDLIYGDEHFSVISNNNGVYTVIQELTQIAFGLNLVELADLEGDGDLDLFAYRGVSSGSGGSSGSWPPRILLYKNDNGVFQEHQVIIDNAGYKLALSDLDLDGDVDILTYKQDEFEFIWLENLNSESFEENEIDFYSAFNSSSFNKMDVVDVDGDGDDDVLLANYSSDGGTAYLENLNGNGCIDPAACNYDSEAYQDDQSCCYTDCGCTDPIAENYDSTATCENNSCDYIFGCMDPIAENFDSLATVDDGSCEYIFGCDDPNAQNYDETATVNDGSCLYTLSGVVFYDHNSDGVMNGDDYGLPLFTVNFGFGLMAITNDLGEFFVVDASPASYSVFLETTPAFPYTTTPNPFSGVLGTDWSGMISFGVSDNDFLHALTLNYYPTGGTYQCDVIRSHVAFVRNEGNIPMDGVVKLTYDELFQGYEDDPIIDSVMDNMIFMSFEDLLPGEYLYFNVGLITPTADFLGEFLTTTVEAWGFQDNDTIAFVADSASIELTCAYDPNDKQVFPNGYSDQHYIADNQELEYFIRFQNTGNAPATDVFIVDSISPWLDMYSFELVANSHSVYTTIDVNERVVVFNFDNIMLPDSVNNEPESHGFVSFKISPHSNVALLTEINNTAEIYFDNNDPVITNTTWSTIYDCSLFEINFSDLDAPILNATEGDLYQWFLYGEPIVGATEQTLEAIENGGEYSVQIDNDFPCSGMSQELTVWWLSLIEISEDEYSLYPNPANNLALIESELLVGEWRLQVTDVKGRLLVDELRQANNSSIQIEASGLARGQYRVVLTQDQVILTAPLMVD